MGRKTKVGGIVALGVAAAAAAYWKWGMSSDEKQRVKDTIKDKANTLKENANNLSERIPKEVKKTYADAKSKVEETITKVSDKFDSAKNAINKNSQAN